MVSVRWCREMGLSKFGGQVWSHLHFIHQFAAEPVHAPGEGGVRLDALPKPADAGPAPAEFVSPNVSAIACRRSPPTA